MASALSQQGRRRASTHPHISRSCIQYTLTSPSARAHQLQLLRCVPRHPQLVGKAGELVGSQVDGLRMKGVDRRVMVGIGGGVVGGKVGELVGARRLTTCT